MGHTPLRESVPLQTKGTRRAEPKRMAQDKESTVRNLFLWHRRICRRQPTWLVRHLHYGARETHSESQWDYIVISKATFGTHLNTVPSSQSLQHNTSLHTDISILDAV